MPAEGAHGPAAPAIARMLRQRAAGGGLWIDVDGASMRPTLAAPARVVVGPGLVPRVGEVWAFVDRDGAVIVHRCIRRGRDGTLGFMGDGAADPDEAVPVDRLVGRVWGVADAHGDRPVRRNRTRAVVSRARGWSTRVRRFLR